MSAARGLLLALVFTALGAFLLACGDSEDSSTSTAVETTTTTAEAAQGDEEGDGEKVAVQASVPGLDPQQIYADVSPGVVTVLSVFGGGGGGGAGGAGGGQAGQGSGFVLNDDGEIATNAHVVTDATEAGGDAGNINAADEVYVEFGDRNQVEAEVVGFDPDSDVALLKIDPDGLELEPIELGDSDAVAVGEPVAAIGSPFGQERSISTGIISATDRSIESLTQFRIEGAIQTDASINPGNSGGPLINADGKVVGIDQQINTTSGGNEGVGFAVPINLVKRSIEDLRDDGEASYAYIGVSSQPLYPQLAEELDIDAPTGSLVSSITPDGPADDAGLQGCDGQPVRFQGSQVDVGGDVIVAVDGTELVAENDLSRLIAQNRPGDTIKLDIIRDGDEMTVDIKLEARPDSLPASSTASCGGG